MCLHDVSVSITLIYILVCGIATVGKQRVLRLISGGAVVLNKPWQVVHTCILFLTNEETLVPV